MVGLAVRPRELARWVLLGVAGAILIFHSLAYNFVTDDAYISFVYSRNFAEHGQLVFNLGDPVEGYTNFSWTVVLGLLMKLGIPPEIASRILGTACALVTLYLVMRATERALGRPSAWSAVPSLLLACSSGFACWTSGGLETQLFTVLVAAALDAVVGATERPARLHRAAICLALAAMTRPEGPLVAAVLGTVWVAYRLIARVSEASETRDLRRWWAAIVAAGSALVLGALALEAIATLGAGLGTPVVVLVVAGIAIAIAGLVACIQIARNRRGALLVVGGALALLGGAVALAALKLDRHGVHSSLDLGWDRLVPNALAALVLAATCLGTWVATYPEPLIVRAELVATAWFLGLWLPWFVWRWWYYGYPFPNTYYVKASGPWRDPAFAKVMFDNGLYYVWVWLVQTRLLFASPLVVLGLVGALAIRRSAPRENHARFVLALACGTLGVVYAGYAISVGGDFMGLHRFIMPVFVAAAILVTLGLEWLIRRLPDDTVVFPGSPLALGLAISTLVLAIAYLAIQWPRAWSGIAIVAAVAACLALGRLTRTGIAAAAGMLVVGTFAIAQLDLTRHSLDPRNLASDHGIDTPAFLRVYTEDRATIGRAMESCFRADDFSIVGGAGAQPYFGRMRGIDVFGLVSETIAHRAPRIRPRAGHTKWGSDTLLAAYHPDFIFSCYRIHESPRTPGLPCAGFWLARGFEPVTLHIPGLVERGEYYTFLASKSRRFQCPGRVRP